MVKRKETQAVDIELQERTFRTNHVYVHVETGECPVWCSIVVCIMGQALFGLRKDLEARFEEFTTLAKKRKRDPKFSGFGSLHLSGDDTDVSLPRMCHWVTRKWHKNHPPSLSDVAAAFSSVRCKDVCGMLTLTDAELLSTHYISGDFIVSNECTVTRRMSELMSRGLKVVCSQQCLSPTPRIPTPPSPPLRSPPLHIPTPTISPHLCGPNPPSPPLRIPTHASPTPPSPPLRSPSHSSPTSPSPPLCSPPHASSSHASPPHLQRLEARLIGVEAQLAMMWQQQANIIRVDVQLANLSRVGFIDSCI
ncbi:putative terpene synthase 11 [Dorcoceras hygrometricum]|uniref:Putative terpene synthase 11 n=1 Tax=Dorcoceras hygrometricum TaxID=472368 RepID=A0A2Z7CJF1_9LAMI|nr:putative terpene synthase 11 [Dorcoceras hygrometricum]